jgi:hypothetical protein
VTKCGDKAMYTLVSRNDGAVYATDGSYALRVDVRCGFVPSEYHCALRERAICSSIHRISKMILPTINVLGSRRYHASVDYR